VAGIALKRANKMVTVPSFPMAFRVFVNQFRRIDHGIVKIFRLEDRISI
jgi:hypothetical protein